MQGWLHLAHPLEILHWVEQEAAQESGNSQACDAASSRRAGDAHKQETQEPRAASVGGREGSRQGGRAQPPHQGGCLAPAGHCTLRTGLNAMGPERRQGSQVHCVRCPQRSRDVMMNRGAGGACKVPVGQSPQLCYITRQRAAGWESGDVSEPGTADQHSIAENPTHPCFQQPAPLPPGSPRPRAGGT